MPQENHHLCQRKCTPMKYYFCLSNVNTQSACHISEFYTGWLTHWGEKNAQTDADFTAAALEKILQKNGSAVLYVCLNLYHYMVWKSHFE